MAEVAAHELDIQRCQLEDSCCQAADARAAMEATLQQEQEAAQASAAHHRALEARSQHRFRACMCVWAPRVVWSAFSFLVHGLGSVRWKSGMQGIVTEQVADK